MKYLNLKFDDELLKKFKIHCIIQNCSMTSKIIELIEEELKSNVSSNQSSNLSSNQPINQQKKIIKNKFF